ncbi:transporter substrate-binding domain-containing protein [Pseudaminobacter sp. NGMCC 1.201702]|uniref:transporter substrate-binding domain-containing protein n=1 Tax=Pseudaminobacter sp. NGMCC 1.201702 TaxID=3391825 RepID=UPI0039EE4CDB
MQLLTALFRHVVCALAVALLALNASASAQEVMPAKQQVTVGVYISPPFVIRQGERYSGMAIDLWEEIAAKLNLTSEYREFRNYSELVGAVASGAVQAAVTNLSITETRANIVDFTHPWFDAGLRIMVHTEAGTTLNDIFGNLGDAGHLQVYAWIAFVILAATVLLTLFDRTFDRDFPKRWRDGLAESFYHVMSVATSGKASRKNLFGWAGRIWQGLWMICGVAVIAYITSSVTSVMTAAQVANQINSVADLPGKLVGVHAGSVSEEFMKASFANTRPFDRIEDAANALINDEISAIVGDNPVLEYFAHTHSEMPLDIVGNVFQPDKYGFAFTAGSALTKRASVAIIAAHESGKIEELRTKYFGLDP